MIAPAWFWCLVTFVFGITIGSFLNVVIWRLPQGISVNDPAWSFCPNCKRRLTAIDLVPLFSFLILGQRCRSCKQPISWRYFAIELLTGLLFVALYLRYPQDAANCVALLLFTAVLIPVFFIDLATFHIPDSLNLLAFGVAVGRDVWGIAQHEPGHELVWGWLPRSILGAVVGVLIFGVVRILGWLWKRVEAMGLGDVLLARAMGAMLISVTPAAFHPLRLFPIWVLLACFSGVIVGPALILIRRAQAAKLQAVPEPVLDREDEPEEEENSSLTWEVLAVGYCLVLGDLVDYVRDLLRGRRGQAPEPQEDNWQPAPTAIPFGPFMVIGFLATVFIGEPLTAWYLAYALPRPQPLEG
ncbi:MAG TPA: prepilin peptidase [Chthonomonadaceae bacterium]|nr:prepilin peptidase [Chthonomonadaceae bacterium]